MKTHVLIDGEVEMSAEELIEEWNYNDSCAELALAEGVDHETSQQFSLLSGGEMLVLNTFGIGIENVDDLSDIENAMRILLEKQITSPIVVKGRFPASENELPILQIQTTKET